MSSKSPKRPKPQNNLKTSPADGHYSPTKCYYTKEQEKQVKKIKLKPKINWRHEHQFGDQHVKLPRQVFKTSPNQGQKKIETHNINLNKKTIFTKVAEDILKLYQSNQMTKEQAYNLLVNDKYLIRMNEKMVRFYLDYLYLFKFLYEECA